MSYQGLDLEEGRVALHQLEGQLKQQGVVKCFDDAGSVGSRPSLNSERRMLDQVPRDTRLHYRQGSPLGLTVEELDDRGLLDGGGSVPNYYTSSRQRSRRPLEMKKRSSRLEERGKEAPSKLINALFHMVRTLVRRGLPIETYCRNCDVNGRGLIDKKSFSAMLRRIGLPFVPKDMIEITSRYTVPTTDMVDYETLLKDTGVFAKEYNSFDTNVEGLESIESLRGTDIGMYTGVLLDVKRMLLESVQSLGKQMEDVYRMFARWDSDGTGAVTATQFLRVLARLHVDLSDQDQDLVVELLDTNAKGRIDFISLLKFCFYEAGPELGLPNAAMIAGGNGDDATSGNGETSSAISTEGQAEQKSVGSNNGHSRRPHTATSARPVIPDNYNSQQRNVHTDMDNMARGQRRQHDYSGHHSGSGGSRSSGVGTSGGNGGGGIGSGGASQAGSASKGQRPLTASARVSTNQHEGRFNSMQQNVQRSGGTAIDIDQQQQQKQQQKQQLSLTRRADDPQFVMELADDVIDDNEDLMLLTPQSVYNRHPRYDDAYAGIRDHNAYDGIDGHDGASFNDNTLVTDQDEYYFGSPQGNLTAMNSKDMWNSQSLDGLTANQDNQLPSVSSHRNQRWSQDASNNFSLHPASQLGEDHGEAIIVNSDDHQMQLLANEMLTMVREMVLSRLQTEKTPEEIFQDFDCQGKGYFDAEDFIHATSDLQMEMSEQVACFAITQIALDGRSQVSLGEFKVFLLDEDHWELENNIQLQMAKLLEMQGRKFQSRLYHVFWEQDEAFEGNNTQAAKTGLVSREAFLAGIQMLRLRANSSEIERLVTRFDANGNGLCSVTRFLQMAQSSQAWQAAEKTLAMQEEAQDEAASLRRQIRETGIASLTEEVIAMAEYLGICVISEQHILWIAIDALKVNTRTCYILSYTRP